MKILLEVCWRQVAYITKMVSLVFNCFPNLWKRWEYQTTWPASWETYMQARKQQLELDME